VILGFNKLILCMFFCLVSVGFLQFSAFAQVANFKARHQGIILMTVEPGDIKNFDVRVMVEAPAVQKMRSALNLIYKQSEFSRKKIELLKKNGRVIIVYNPQFPDRKQTAAQLLLAVFKPSYFRKPGSKEPPKKDFLVIVSRLGIQWPVKELSAVLVHELVGHGIQHLRGRLKTMRSMDLECEAWLYQERAHQDLGLDKLSKDMVTFRVQLERVNCVGFRKYQRINEPVEFKVWDELNPDVDRLLVSFERYLAHLRASGETGRALSNKRKIKEARLAKIFSEGPADTQFTVGMGYRQGIGNPRDDKKAAQWLKKSADNGYGQAKTALAEMYAKGEGVKKNLSISKRLYFEAAQRGDSKALGMIKKEANVGRVWAQFSLGYLYESGQGVGKNIEAAAKWYVKAADQGSKAALSRLKQLPN
jgi:hypothetical protein